MSTHSIARVLIAAVAAAGIGFAAAPAAAQDPSADQVTTTKKPVVKRKQATQIVPPPSARVVVRKRSYLDPGTETKRYGEHNLDYAFPSSNSRNGMDRFLNDYNITFTNNPIPSCLDLAGFCH
jgi:hypothetical protein